MIWSCIKAKDIDVYCESFTRYWACFYIIMRPMLHMWRTAVRRRRNEARKKIGYWAASTNFVHFFWFFIYSYFARQIFCCKIFKIIPLFSWWMNLVSTNNKLSRDKFEFLLLYKYPASTNILALKWDDAIV